MRIFLETEKGNLIYINLFHLIQRALPCRNWVDMPCSCEFQQSLHTAYLWRNKLNECWYFVIKMLTLMTPGRIRLSHSTKYILVGIPGQEKITKINNRIWNVIKLGKSNKHSANFTIVKMYLMLNSGRMFGCMAPIEMPVPRNLTILAKLSYSHLVTTFTLFIHNK